MIRIARFGRARGIAGLVALLLAACGEEQPLRGQIPQTRPEDAAAAVGRDDPSLRLVAPARFLDRVPDARAGEGDELVLVFTMEVEPQAPAPYAVTFPVAGDLLGVGAEWRPGPQPNEITIALGSGANLRPQQHFVPGTTRPGSPSGVTLSGDRNEPAVLGARSGTLPRDDVPVDIVPEFVLREQRLGADPTVAVAIGDLDGDGDADIVSAHREQPLRLFLGQGGGEFDAGTTLLGAREVTDIALSDLDRDGDLDLVAVSKGSSSLVWRNDGRAIFQRAMQMAGAPVRALAVGDIDGDGWKDLVLGANGAERVWYGRGSCAFERGPVFGATSTCALLLGDLDGDRDLDLVDVADAGGTRSAHTIWINTGHGRFETGGKLGGNDARGARLADLDRDGDLDVLLGDSSAARVLLNDGRARFLAGPALAAVGPWAPAVGDIDGDGNLDLVQPRGHDTTWLRGTGDGRFEPIGSSLAVSDVRASELADIDGDGDLDLCLATNEGVAVARGSLACSRDRLYLEPGSLAGGAPLGRDLALADLDGDGWQDVIVAGPDGVRMVRYERGFGFASPVTLPLDSEDGTSEGASAVEVADVDADGRLDIVAGGLGGARVWLAGSVPLQFRPGPRLPGALATAVRARDFDGDGRVDLALGTDADPRAFLWLAREASYEPAATDDASPRFGSASRLVAGDFDGDGRTDLAVGSRVGMATVVWRNRADSTLEPLAELGAGLTLGLDAADYDHDGDLDLLTADASAGEGNPCARLWRQASPGVFEIDAQFGTGAASTASFADLDGDGRLEVLLGFHDRPCEIWRRSPKGGYALATSFGDPPTQALVAADIDRDGDVDLLQGCGQVRGSYVWWNQ